MTDVLPWQVAPPEPWPIWECCSDGMRASGVTFAGARYVATEIMQGKRIFVAGHDNRFTAEHMMRGHVGVLFHLMDLGFTAQLSVNPQAQVCSWTNGARCTIVPVDDIPARLIGTQVDLIWIDECARRPDMQRIISAAMDRRVKMVLTGVDRYPLYWREGGRDMGFSGAVRTGPHV